METGSAVELAFEDGRMSSVVLVSLAVPVVTVQSVPAVEASERGRGMEEGESIVVAESSG
jgi:hypothetical protein